jgi:hypothetical protein
MINGLVAYLLTQTPITALVGQTIQPPPAPANLSDYPCITYQVVSYVPQYTEDGPIGVSDSRVVFNCFATTYLQATTLAQLVITALSGYSGTLPDGTNVFLATIVNLNDQYVDAARTLYRSSVHVMVQFAG